MIFTTQLYVNWRVLFIFVKQKSVDVQFCEAECIKIDAKNKKVYCRSNQNNNLNGQEEFVVDYDFLVIAMGANVNTFNTPGVVENCHFLKVLIPSHSFYPYVCVNLYTGF